MKAGKWEARLRRANELAAAHPSAAQGLRYYERVAGFQMSLYAGAETQYGAAPPAAGGSIIAGIPGRSAGGSTIAGTPGRSDSAGSLRGELDLAFLMPWFPSFLALQETIAPPPLAQSAHELGAGGTVRWHEVLDASWSAAADRPAGLSPGEALICWMFLQPHAEHLADRSPPPPPDSGTPRLCPLCSAKPLVGVLRPRGDGGKRTLVCSLCAHEWEYRRIVCAACGEESVDKLPVYVAAELPHIRVEACDTCRHYIKTVDLTRDGHAVPVVDELAAIPLSLWAEENRYTKIRANYLGV
jgi:FdhE protein